MNMKTTLNKIKIRFVTYLAYIVAFIFIVFEETIWEYLAKPIRDFISYHLSTKAKEFLHSLNKYLIAFIFVLLLVIAELVGLLAGIMFIKMMPLWGTFLYGVKIVVAGIAFWILSETKEKLMSIRVFAIGYNYIYKLINYVKNMEAYRIVREKMLILKEKIKAFKEKHRGLFVKAAQRVYRTLKKRK